MVSKDVTLVAGYEAGKKIKSLETTARNLKRLGSLITKKSTVGSGYFGHLEKLDEKLGDEQALTKILEVYGGVDSSMCWITRGLLDNALDLLETAAEMIKEFEEKNK